MVHSKQKNLNNDSRICRDASEVSKRFKKNQKKKSESLKNFLKRSYEDLHDFGESSYEILKKTEQLGTQINVTELVSSGYSGNFNLNLKYVYVIVGGETAFLNNVFVLNNIEGRDALSSLFLFENLLLSKLWFYHDMLVIEILKENSCEKCNEKLANIESIVPIFTARNKIGTVQIDFLYDTLVIRRGGSK